MKKLALLMVLSFWGCTTQPLVQEVSIESDPPGARIEVDNDYRGTTPLTTTITRDPVCDHCSTFENAIVSATPTEKGSCTKNKTIYGATPTKMFFNMKLCRKPASRLDIRTHKD